MFKVSFGRLAALPLQLAAFGLLAFHPQTAEAQPVKVWSSFNTVPNSALIQYPIRSYTDPAGNTFQIGAIESGPGTNMLLTRYDPAGNVIYSVQYGVPNTNDGETGFFVRSDSSENCYVSEFQGGNTYGQTLKYDPNGNLLWTVPFPAIGQPASFQVDASGNSYHIMYQHDGSFNNPAIHVVKLDSSGNSIYDVQFPGANTQFIFPKSALGSDGSVYIIGAFGTLTGYSAYLLKVNPDGSLGFQKTYSTGGTADQDMNQGVYLDAAGNIDIYGTYGDSNIGDVKSGVMRYDSAGNFQWLHRYTNTTINDMAVDAVTGEIFLCGTKQNISLNNDAMTMKLDASGNTVWTSIFANVGNVNTTHGDFLIPDGSGGVFTQVSCNQLGIGIVAYDVNGAIVWPTTGIYVQGGIFYTPGGQYLFCDGFFRDSAGDFYLGGESVPTSSPRIGLAVKFSSDPKPLSVTFNPTAAPDGASTTGTVTLTKAAGVGGVAVTLTGTAAGTVPASVTVLQGATTATFTAVAHNSGYTLLTAPVTAAVGVDYKTGSFTARPSNYAQFISQTIPTSMIAGQTYTFSLQFKNNGSVTWDTAHLYRVGSASPYNNTTWGVTRLALTSGPVAPGATGTFSGTVFAPVTTGVYNSVWQPIEENVSFFGPFSPSVAVTVTKVADAARYISKTGAVTVAAGSDFTVQNTMKNVGTLTWTTAAYTMRSMFNNWTATKMSLPANCAPTAQVTCTQVCTAPITPGTYKMQWQMDHSGTLFGDLTPLLNIVVTAGPNNASYVSRSAFSTSIAPNTSFSGTFTMKNLGTATWNNTYSLVSIGSNNFGVASIASGSVVQNANGSFTATFTSPVTPGTYTLQYRMSIGGVKFGQPTTSLTMLVGADAAQYISRTGPNTVNAGADFFVQNTMKNTGSTSWTAAAGYYMMSQNPANDPKWTITKMFLPGAGPFAPGASVTFTGKCTAPITPATYTMQWQMSKSGVAFGEKSPLLSIVVTAGPDNAQFMSQTGVPTTKVHGTTFSATITMKNIGSATWDGTYTLVPIGTNNFNVTSIAATTTAPNGTKAFTATFTAPAAGTYTFQMRMKHGANQFGQPSTPVTITVT